MGWNRSQSFQVACEESGEGFPVLLIHGRLNDSRLWAPVARLLATDHRMIRCDLAQRPGQDHPAALLALLQERGVSRVHLVSHGAGWSWAAGVSARAPHLAASLAVVDPVVPRVEQSNAVQEAWHLEMLLQWLAVSHGNTVRKPEHATALAAVVAEQTHARMAGGPNEAPLTPAAGTDLPPLAGVHCPVLALVGQEATVEAKALVGSVFGQAGQFRLNEVAGAVRHCPVEAPEAVAALLRQFWTTCP